MTQEFEQFALRLCARPGMYVGSETYSSVCAYLSGFDAARDFGPLFGFHPWLVLRRQGGNNVMWEGLVMDEALGAGSPRGCDSLSPEENRRCIAKLSDLLKEFFATRAERNAVTILFEYASWLREQDWYHGPLADKKGEVR